MELIRKFPVPALVVAVLAILLVVFKFLGADKPPEFVQKGLSVFMEQQAEQAALLSTALEGGAQVVVIDLDREGLGFDQRDCKKVLELIKQGGLNILQVEPLVYDEARGWDYSQSGFPYLEFLRVAEEYPNADAVISLCGIPYFDKTSNYPDLADLPKLLVSTSLTDDENAEALFDEGWLYATTVAREQPAGSEVGWVFELLVSQ